MAHGAAELRGVGVGNGVAVGRVLTMPEPLSEPAEGSHGGDAAAEKAAVAVAVVTAAADLRSRAGRVDGAGKEIIEAAIQMAQDPMLADDVNARIDAGTTAERAVFEGFRSFQQQLTALGGHMAERAADLGDVAQRIIAALRGVPVPGLPDSDAPFILLARDLAPADTALLDRNKVLGLITRDGGPTSHTAILARAQAIPAIVGVGADAAVAEGTRVLLDAASGIVTVDPSDAQVADAEKRIAERAAQAAAPITEGALADGTKIPLLANLGSLAEAANAVELGAEGVGLFRTEFLFLDAQTAPSVADQQTHYRELLSHFAGKKVVVRALDAGADKPLAFLHAAHEQNPALGLRGLRALRVQQQILTDQLQALKNAQDEAIASGHPADLWVMAPMVADAGETGYFVEFGKRLGLRTVGVMAEVPSLALVADQVLTIADFVSIGTNDLTQYTLAADRMLGTVASYQDPWHPALLRLVKMLGDAGAAAGKSVGICGEAAADPKLAVVLVGLGATTLSMAPAALADVRAELAGVTLEQAKAKAAAALAAESAESARAAAAAA
ncbi:MAG TPA: phosphoenolpyruvate--protein phosphotransferase [Pseudolysinimonas sp.]|nr:phosphoenolpyruvate--protein phosphotransferase [Pseudolysinimonas sp.]